MPAVVDLGESTFRGFLPLGLAAVLVLNAAHVLYVHEHECRAHMLTLQDGRYPEAIFNSVNSAIYSYIRHSILGVSMIICYRSLNMPARAKK